MRARLIGLAATLGILLLLVGIPVGLYVAAGSPIPGSMPALGDVTGALTRPDDGTMFMVILKAVGWLAWASFAAMVLLELFARVRHIETPSIAGLGVQQRAAAGLVSAAALLFTASPLLGAAPASAAPVTHPTHTVTSTTVAGETQQAPQVEQQAPQAQAETKKVATRDYVVQAGDSLYSIAEQQLGDGSRYAEIAKLNYGITQADGSSLTSSHWIQPGWTLKIPDTAAPATSGPVVVEAGDTLSKIAQETLGDANRYPELFEASRGTEQPGGAHLSDPDLIYPGWTITVPGQSAAPDAETPDTAPAPQQQAPETAPERAAPQDSQEVAPESAAPETEAEVAPPADVQEPADQADQGDEVDADEETGFPVRTAAGVGSLMAAGLLALIAARRTRQQRRRRPGQDMPMPTGEALEVEQELRAVADPMSVETVDLALRTLSARCAAEGMPLPTVRAGRLTADQFDLYLAEPAQLPAPWDGTADGTVWTLSGEAEDLIRDEDVADVPAPYPALVTIGHDEEDGHVFLDLEYLGALGVIGDGEQTRQVMAALAVELATSRWADDLQVTIVGAYAELEDSLETGRVRYVPSAGRLLEELQHRAEQDRAALISSGAGDLNHARVQNATPGAWTPEIVLFTGDMTDSQRTMLTQLVEELPRVAIAAVTSGEAVGEWAVRLTGEQTGTLEPLGLSVRPQLLDDDTYAQVLMVLATTDVDDETEHAEWAAHDEPTLADLETIVSDPAETDLEEEATVDQAEEQQVDDEKPTVVVEEPTAETEETAAAAEVDDVVEDAPDEVEEPVAATADEVEVVEEQVDLGTRSSGEDLDETTAESDLVAAQAAAIAQGTTTDVDDDQVDEQEPPAAAGDETDDPADEEPAVEPAAAAVTLMPRRGPQILLMGTVEIANASGPVEPSKQARLTELAAILAVHPGCDHTTIDECYSPGKRVTDNARNTQISKLRRWLGKTAEGDDFLPRYQVDTGYKFHEHVTSDWSQWNELLPEGPANAPTETLEQALSLVRGRPFHGVRARYYTWAETLKQDMIRAIVDASYELARRRFMDGRWRGAEEATLTGLGVEPGMECLWRVRILAAHARGNTAAVQEAVDRLLAIADDWGGELETETEELLEQLNNGSAPSRTLAASAH